jgi:hypothetical protein
MNLPDAPIAHEGFFATHFFPLRDQGKSKDFYLRILGGKVIKPDNPCYIKLANTWIILNSGGGPTPVKPEVLLETPSDLNRVNSSATCVIPTAASSRSANILKSPSTGSTTAVNLAYDKLENLRGFLGSAHKVPSSTRTRSAEPRLPRHLSTPRKGCPFARLYFRRGYRPPAGKCSRLHSKPLPKEPGLAR